MVDSVRLDLRKVRNWKASLRDTLSRTTATSGRSYNRAAKYIPGGLSRHILYLPPHPLYWARASGARLIDLDGNEFVDFACEYTAALYGHSNGAVVREASRVISEGIARGGPTEYESEFAELLCARFGFDAVRFSNTGTEANLIALGLARKITGAEEVVVFEGSYHGGVLDFEANGAGQLNIPGCFRVFPFNSPEVLDYLGSGRAPAAVLVEPVLGSGGCIAADVGWLREIIRAAQARGVIVIFDEVITARLGPAGLQGEWDLRPDLTTLGKFLGAGFTLSAIGGNDSILRLTDSRRQGAVQHHGTFNNNVLGVAAGLVGMRDIFTAERCRELNQNGEQLRIALNKVCSVTGTPLRFRGIGSIMAPFVKESPHELSQEVIEAFVYHCAASGLFVGTIALISLCLEHSVGDRDQLVRATHAFITELCANCV